MMAIIGSGAVRPGLSCDRAGTSEGINYCSEKSINSPSLRTLPHAVPGLYTVAGILSSTGRVFEWFRRITNQTAREYDDILREIYALPLKARAPRFFPSRHRGPIWDFNQGIFAGLQPEHTHIELGKGVVEAIAFGILDVVETLNGEGCSVSSLRGTGGQYRNLLWNRMKADILGIPLEIPLVIDAELIGNLCAALVGEGRYSGLAEAAEDLVRIEERIEPDMERHAVYRELYGEYRAACALIPETNP
ncbi:FGGY-family carbohydrate kinase [Marispirochaeta sp.]|uniref:xylulokinase n=1 Tax=Marispirochaeta sp. TaxID=2038653 RepID=UPI0029C734DE|nr:FGGY-family carbohydrate kinase [Marispirochaeta sp.]